MSIENSGKAQNIRRGLCPAEYMRIYRAVRSGKMTVRQAERLGLWKKKNITGRPSKLSSMIAAAKSRKSMSASDRRTAAKQRRRRLAS